ncbi:MAG: glycoside hydrolase family 57 protein [bacterium]
MIPTLNVALIWHHHQPTYKDPQRNKYLLPWTRMHAVKDYFYMANLVSHFPRVHYTANITPILLAQISDYIYNYANDIYLEVTNRSVEELSVEDKRFILENFFETNLDYFIKPYPSYYSLYQRVHSLGIDKALETFTPQDYLDLQVWYNLTWFDPYFKMYDPIINKFFQMEHFDEEHKRLLIRKQLEVISMIISKYKELVDMHQVELITSPFYHPILPLLVNTDVARDVGISSLPGINFSHPEDAVVQIKNGMNEFSLNFENLPNGMWPSELAVSNEALNIIKSAGIKWIVADEDILLKTIHYSIKGDTDYLQVLCRPYYVNTPSGKLVVFFRNKALSNLIGFTYTKWNPQDAAVDLVTRLEDIRFKLPPGREYIVVIALDGENCWSYYPENGWNFLTSLYRRLSSTAGLKPITPSIFLDIDGNYEVLQGVLPGSWVNASFDTWIGQSSTNLAWEYLAKVRNDIERFKKTKDAKLIEEAMNYLYTAEGSDWFWWYNIHHSTKDDATFDRLFRSYLREVYIRLDETIPDFIEKPIEKNP